MTLLNTINASLSGLQAAEAGLKATSQNISNVNTPGYSRVELTTAPRVLAGQGGAGVDVSGLRRAADRFLAAAALSAESRLGATTLQAELLDRAQAAFGDPATDTSTFAIIDKAFSSLTVAASDPSSSLQRARALSDVNALFSEIERVGAEVSSLRVEADQRIADAVRDLDGLLGRVSDLNREIQTTRANGGDTSAAENAQDQLLQTISGLLDVRATPRQLGGVELRTSGGELLVGERAAQVRFSPSANPRALGGTLEIVDSSGLPRPLEIDPRAGVLGGLVDTRDRALPELADAIGALAGAAADALNAAHNDNSTVPAPNQLVGRATGLGAGDALNFSGGVTIGVVNNVGGGALTQRIEIDFDANAISTDAGVTWTAIPAAGAEPTIGELGAALAPLGVTFTIADGRATLSAAGAQEGVVVRQGATGLDPSDRGGRGFAHFFGLNDLVSRATPNFFETGLTSADLASAPGFTGGVIELEIRDPAGRVVARPSVTPNATSLQTSLDSLSTALAGYAELSFDARTGTVSLEAAPGYSVVTLADTTNRNGTALTAFFGLSEQARADRSGDLSVRPKSGGDLAFARPDLTQALGARVVETGDGAGAYALAAAKSEARAIGAAAGLPATRDGVLGYAATVGALAGRRAADAESALSGAREIQAVATQRRDEAQKVNLDEEIVKMTQYQQSYAAAARVMQAAQEMLDILLDIV